MKYLSFLCFIFISVHGIAQQPKILWWFDTHDSAFGQSAMGDMDNDGNHELVFGCYRNDSMVYALNAEDGSLLWKYNTSGFGEGCNDVAAAIYDVDFDGTNDVIVPSSCNPFTYCFSGLDGTVKWKAPTRGSDSPPVIIDLDGDSIPEVIHGEFGGYVICLNAVTGAFKWEIKVDSNSWIQTAPTVADINGDGQLDIVVATWHFDDNNAVYAYNGQNQQLLWTRPVADVVYHGTAVADILNNGKIQLIIGDYSGTLYVLNGEDGSLAWSWDAGGYIGSPVSVADLDDNGHCEMIFTAGSKMIALQSNALPLWTFTIPNAGQSFRGAALSDIDNDQLPDVVFGTSSGRLMALKGNTGQVIVNLDLAGHMGKPFDINHAPVIGDFDKNGFLDAFLVGGQTTFPDFQTNYGRAYAVELGKGAGPEWPMFQFNHRRTGSLCTSENTAVDELKRTDNFSIIPNPIMSGQSFEVHILPEYRGGILDIRTITGNLVYQTTVFDEVNTVQSVFHPGVYLLSITTGKHRLVQRVVVGE